MLAKKTESMPRTLPPSMSPESGSKQSIAPIMMMPEIALVTLIRGVWSAGVTFQMTMKPIKMAKTKVMSKDMNEEKVAKLMPTNRRISKNETMKKSYFSKQPSPTP